MPIIKRIYKRVFKGASWKNPILNTMLHVINPADFLVRHLKGINHLPPFSIRVRSNGIYRQFGGERFQYYGNLIKNILQENALLKVDTKVLEIGCGCGRTAISLTNILKNGNYTGMDIEKISLEACKNNKRLTSKEFSFDCMDIYNKLYNPVGKQLASSYVFPYSNNSFDVIFLISVFTHMLPNDIQNYIKETSRILKNSGRILFSTFLMDYGTYSNQGTSFPFYKDGYYYNNKNSPEAAVGYKLSFFEDTCKMHGLSLIKQPILGSWRNKKQICSISGFPQDILIFSK